MNTIIVLEISCFLYCIQNAVVVIELVELLGQLVAVVGNAARVVVDSSDETYIIIYRDAPGILYDAASYCSG